MFNPIDITNLFELLDNEIDVVSIEENNDGADVTLDKIKASNSGNNCLHYDLILNKHRIVIQTYKELSRKGNVDVVQGKPELEPVFGEILEELNAYSDEEINKLFVLYCGLWSKCTFFYRPEMDSFVCDFGPYVSLTWSDGWRISVAKGTVSDIQIMLDFIVAMEDICR
jgi:hypothetical protein